MVNNDTSEYDPWNDEPPEEIVTEGVRLQQVDVVYVGMYEVEPSEQHGTGSRSQASTCESCSVVGGS